jgi:hypothetical protein
VPNALPASASVIRRRAVDLLDTCRDVGRPVVIVSNNEHLAGADAITDSNHALAERVRHSPATG